MIGGIDAFWPNSIRLECATGWMLQVKSFNQTCDSWVVVRAFISTLASSHHNELMNFSYTDKQVKSLITGVVVSDTMNRRPVTWLRWTFQGAFVIKCGGS